MSHATATVVAPRTRADGRAPEAVLRYCRREGIQEELLRTLELAREHFAPVEEPAIELVCDPEGDRAWVSVRYRVHGLPSQDALFDRYDRFAADWLQECPETAGDRVRVTCHRA